MPIHIGPEHYAIRREIFNLCVAHKIEDVFATGDAIFNWVYARNGQLCHATRWLIVQDQIEAATSPSFGHLTRTSAFFERCEAIYGWIDGSRKSA